MYASDIIADLYSNKITTVTTENMSIQAEISTIGTKYIAFVLTTPDYYVSEISVYGDAKSDEEDEVVFTTPNVIKNQIPIRYTSSDRNTFNFNWHQVRFGEGDWEMYFGYSVAPAIPENAEGEAFWQPYMEKLTDESTDTGLLIKPEFCYTGSHYDDVLMVYQIPDTMVDGISIDYENTLGKVKVYAAPSLAQLYNESSLIAEIRTNKINTTVKKAVSQRARFVSFVFEEPSCVINEIEIHGTDYVRPDYGTNLVLGKNPMSIFVANREYPIGSNGARLWASDAETDRWNDMALIPETQGWFTDNDFTKYKDWLHDGAQKYINTKSHYKVLAYDFGSISTLNKILVDSNMGGYDIYVSEKFNDLYKSTSRVYSSGGDQLLPNGELDPATDLEYGENLIDVAGVTGRYMAIVITRSNRLGVECWDAIPIREIQVYGTPGTVYTGDNLISGKTPIFINRADYGAYDVQLENYQVQGGGAKAYTDGKYFTGGTVQFPNSGGTLVYRNGALVMTYYLEVTCDVEAFAMHSGYYYGPGGVDLYVSESFDTLFDDESCVFTSGGETADDDGIYDVSKNLGTGTLSIKLDAPKRGRYAAFVITRIYDIGVIGASGILRIAEIELFGKRHSIEQLPTTTITDSATGNKATFNYQNPDDTFIFADKGIASFRMAKVSDIDLKSNRFANILLQNRFKAISDAFKLEFLDKEGKVIPVSKLEGENITFEYALSSDKMVRLGEIRKDSIYVIRDAQQYENKMKLTSEELSGYTFVLLEPLSGEDLKYNGIVIDTTPTLDDNDQTSAGTTDNTVGTAGNTNGSIVDNNTQADNNTVGENTDNANKPNKKPAGSNKQWVVVDDPLEWLWNIYDTFAANIWMLILCIVALVGCVGGIVAQIIFYKKRRKN